MEELNPKDFFQTTCINNESFLNRTYDDLTVKFRGLVTEKLQDIVSETLGARASFMEPLITGVIDSFKNELETKINKDIETIVENTNGTCNYLSDVKNEEHLYRLLGQYEDSIEDKDILNIDTIIDRIIDDYVEKLRRVLNQKFEFFNNSQIYEDIDYICGGSKRTLIDSLDAIKSELANAKDTVVNSFKEAIADFEKKFLEQMKNTMDEYIPGFDKYEFNYDGHHITYKFENHELKMYDGDTKVNNTQMMEAINRQIQDRFPQAKDITDSMINNISQIRMDNATPQENPFKSIAEEEKKTELKPDIILDAWDQQGVTEQYISEDEINSLLSNNNQVNKQVQSSSVELTPEERQALMDIIGPDFKPDFDEEVPTAKTVPEELEDEVNMGDMNAILARMDELRKNAQVQEYIKLDNTLKTCYAEYQQSVNQMNQEQEEVHADIKMI